MAGNKIHVKAAAGNEFEGRIIGGKEHSQKSQSCAEYGIIQIFFCSGNCLGSFLVKNQGLTLEGAEKQITSDRSKVERPVKALDSLKAIRAQLVEIKNSL